MIAIDVISLVVGVALAVGLGILVYSQRARIAALRRTVERQATITRERLTRSAEQTYRDAVVELANRLHLAGHRVPLEQIAVTPRFYTLPAPFDPLLEENPQYQRPHQLVPLIPDWPQLLAPYEIPHIPLETLLRGKGHIAVLGQPGSGRTVALALIALRVARQMAADEPGALLDTPRLPVYFHLDDVGLQADAEGKGVDPLTPLADAARPLLRGLAAMLFGGVESELAAGRGLILADGWDELTPQRQRQVLNWLGMLLGIYPGNRLVLAGPVRGCQPLLKLGLAPVYLLPWGNPAYERLAHLWAAAWPQIGGLPRESAAAPAEDLIRRAARGNRALTALEATLRMWATLAGDDPSEGPCGWFAAYAAREAAPELLPELERIGVALLEQPAEASAPAEQPALPEGGESAPLPEAGAASLPPSVPQTRLLVARADRRVVFVHPIIGAYFAARALRSAPLPETLFDGAPLHELALAFLAGLRDMTPYAERRLAARPGILHDELLSLARWCVYADPAAPWRGPFFKRMARLLLKPPQYPLIRERVTAALVATRDANVAYIFREGMQSEEPLVARLSTLGLGALSDPESVLVLEDAVADEDASMGVAAALALGAVGTKPALNALIRVLLSGSELARRAAAEMLGATNTVGEGHEVLREATADENAGARRAAVYGLERVSEPWAQELIFEMERSDAAWMVRTSASLVMEKVRSGDLSAAAPQELLRPESTPWLIKWLDDRNESVAPGVQGVGQLVRALQEGDEATRLAAVEMLSALAIYDAARPLYAALRDPHHEIRDAAHRALGSISLATGHPLPAVM